MSNLQLIPVELPSKVKLEQVCIFVVICVILGLVIHNSYPSSVCCFIDALLQLSVFVHH